MISAPSRATSSTTAAWSWFFLPDRGGTPLQVAHVGAFLRDNQGALELTGLSVVDPEVGHQIHRTAHTLGYIGEGAVAEDGRVEGGVEVVGVGHHRAQVLLYQLRVVVDRLGEGAEDDPLLVQALLVRGGYRDAIEDRVHGDTGQLLLLFQRNAQLVEGLQDLGVHLFQALGAIRRSGRSGVVDDILIIDGRELDVLPLGLLVLDLEPVAVGPQPPLQHEFWLVFLGRDEADGLLVQPLGDGIRLDIGHESVLVFRAGKDFCRCHRMPLFSLLTDLVKQHL